MIKRNSHLAYTILPGIIAVLMLAACGGSTTPPPSATSLIEKANTNFAQLTALHFTLSSHNIKPGSLLSVVRAEGDVKRPDRMQFTASVALSAFSEVPAAIIIIGSDQYFDAGAAGHYSKVGIFPNLLLIFDAKQGIGAILTQFQSPSTPVSETVAGVDCWKIIGSVDSSLLAPITGSVVSPPGPVKSTLWIGKDDGQIHQVMLAGKAADGDTDQTDRTFQISKYNEDITITAPAV